MKTQLILSVLLVAAALAGCASNDDSDSEDNMSVTTPAATSPASATPTTTTPSLPTVTPPGSGDAPAPDPRCLAPPADALAANATAGTRLGMPELSFTARDPTTSDPCYRFLGPQNATAGWNVISLAYGAGQEFHIMPMYAIGNHTQEEILAAFATEQAPEWAEPVGAVGGVTPGQNGSVALELEAGNYFYFCPINGHMMQGMTGMLTVAPATGNATPAAEPDATLTIELVDYNFTVPTSIPANTTVIKVVNNGTEDHEAPLVLLDANTTVMQFLGALEDPNATAPPPGALIGGANAIAPGRVIYLLVDLEAGRNYGMACFVSSEKHGGAPHVAIGPMVAQFAAA